MGPFPAIHPAHYETCTCSTARRPPLPVTHLDSQQTDTIRREDDDAQNDLTDGFQELVIVSECVGNKENKSRFDDARYPGPQTPPSVFWFNRG